MSLPTTMAVVAATLVLAACQDTAMAPSAEAPSPELSFQNGPGVLPHLIRIGPRTLVGWRDPATNLGIIIGAPDDPTSSIRCGGTEPAQILPMQFVGELFGLAKQLALSGTARVLVYEGLTDTLDESLCERTPIATGSVFYLRSDNDFFGAGGRANAFSEHAHGVVALAAGGEASLNARLWGLASPEGVLLWINSSISLQPHGG